MGLSVEEASLFDRQGTGGPTINDGTLRFFLAFGAFSSYSIETLLSAMVSKLKIFLKSAIQLDS